MTDSAAQGAPQPQSGPSGGAASDPGTETAPLSNAGTIAGGLVAVLTFFGIGKTEIPTILRVAPGPAGFVAAAAAVGLALTGGRVFAKHKSRKTRAIALWIACLAVFPTTYAVVGVLPGNPYRVLAICLAAALVITAAALPLLASRIRHEHLHGIVEHIGLGSLVNWAKVRLQRLDNRNHVANQAV